MSRPSSLFPTTIGKLTEKVTKPAFQKKGYVHTRLLSHWHDIVGADLAAEGVPLDVRFPKPAQNKGTLVLRINAAMAPEFQHRQPEILERLAVYFGYRAIDSLTFVHAPLPPRENAKRATQRRIRQADADIKPLLKDQPDDPLTDALARLGESLFRA